MKYLGNLIDRPSAAEAFLIDNAGLIALAIVFGWAIWTASRNK